MWERSHCGRLLGAHKSQQVPPNTFGENGKELETQPGSPRKIQLPNVVPPKRAGGHIQLGEMWVSGTTCKSFGLGELGQKTGGQSEAQSFSNLVKST